MSLKGIMSIAGMSGLFKLVAQTKTGFIVESLSDKKRHPISASQKISMLEDISVFTKGGDMPLKEVFLKMKDHDAEASTIDPKGSPEALKKFFKLVLPDFDEDRVYSSDIKKMTSWYPLIKDLVSMEDPKEETSETSDPLVTGTHARDHHVQTAPDHQKIKAPDKKVASVKTRKKV